MNFDNATNRIQSLIKGLPEDSLLIIHSADSIIRNGDVTFPYRQNSDFYYLTQINRPYHCLVLSTKNPSQLYFPPVTEKQRLWDGDSNDIKNIQRKLNIQEIHDHAQLQQDIPELIAQHKHIIYDFSCHYLASMIRKPLTQSPDGRLSQHKTQDCIDLRTLLHPQRLIKDKEEIECIQKAVDISCQAHLNCMHNISSATYEYQLEALFLNTCNMLGARSVAYPSIVAGGNNACTLHYIDNNDKLNPNDLVLIDAGCEYLNYASDITRTYPISGTFNPYQKALYEAVLDAQNQAIANTRPGATWPKLQQQCQENLTQHCLDLGLLKGSLTENLKNNALNKFYYHGLGHWLGLDVHDAGPYKKEDSPIPFEPGMVITIEPGLYIRPDKSIDPKWWNIGIRIEDDITITPSGCRVLSHQLPKTMTDLEHILKDKTKK
ncbi:MAG TPA: aminopeptidase P family protein [Gammaproteobacteria bacterium]|nr:aminopeptidase P family protein [Gammaproteobacteria bacterium]